MRQSTPDWALIGQSRRPRLYAVFQCQLWTWAIFFWPVATRPFNKMQFWGIWELSTVLFKLYQHSILMCLSATLNEKTFSEVCEGRGVFQKNKLPFKSLGSLCPLERNYYFNSSRMHSIDQKWVGNSKYIFSFTKDLFQINCVLILFIKGCWKKYHSFPKLKHHCFQHWQHGFKNIKHILNCNNTSKYNK